MAAAFPDIFQFKDGRRLADPAGWPARRQEIFDQIIGIEYGGLPATPLQMSAQELISHQVASMNNARHRQVRLIFDGKLSFILDILAPAAPGAYPVIIDGDTCWGPVADEIRRAVLERGYTL